MKYECEKEMDEERGRKDGVEEGGKKIKGKKGELMREADEGNGGRRTKRGLRGSEGKVGKGYEIKKRWEVRGGMMRKMKEWGRGRGEKNERRQGEGNEGRGWSKRGLEGGERARE